jgi:UDP-N-acetylglucosamine 2-epimerase (non-hydrolysing)
MRAAPVIEELRRRETDWKLRLIYSGCADDRLAATGSFEELGLPQPDACLAVTQGDHLSETIGMTLALKGELETTRPNAVMVFGDGSVTLAGALTAAQLQIPVAHVEAGLRSFDRRTPREMNRVVADAVSEWLFTTERAADVNLRAEGLPDQKIHFVGSTMVDALIARRSAAARMHLAETLGLAHPFIVVALSKPQNVDDALQRRSVAYALLTLSDEFDVVWSLGARVSDRIQTFDLDELLATHRRLRLLPTIGYVEFISLLNDAAAVLTDSGGVQQQALVIGTPCVTLSRYTKHPITLAHGGNRLAGTDPHLAVRYIREAVNARAGFAPIPEGWDGHAASRIVDAVEKELTLTGSDERFRR